MSALKHLLGSKTRCEVLRLLFAGTQEEMHLRDLQRHARLNVQALRRELLTMTRLELLRARRDGNRLYFSANREHPLFPELRGLALKTVALGDALSLALRDDRIQIAFVFGSIARGGEGSSSDVDLMVLGTLSLRGLTDLLSGLTEQIGRVINPHIMTIAEYKRRLEKKDHFLTSLQGEPRIFIRGSADELGRLAS